MKIQFTSQHRYNGVVRRRSFLVLLVPAALSAAAPPAATIRGTLVMQDGKPALKTSDGKLVLVTGDEDTTGVLKDTRLAGAEFELLGQFAESGSFAVNPIYTRAMYVHKDGKRLLVTYWCDVCAIRTYTPGICWCCREDTALDLREPDTVK